MFVDVFHLDLFQVGWLDFASMPPPLDLHHEHLQHCPIDKRMHDVNDLTVYAVIAMPPNERVNANYFQYCPAEWYDCRHVPLQIYRQFDVDIMDSDGPSHCHTCSPDLYSLDHCLS